MLADAKFKKTGIVNTYAEAFGKLWSKCVEPWFRHETRQWGNFRAQQLFTNSVDSLLKANMKNLSKVYKKYNKPIKVNKKQNNDSELTNNSNKPVVAAAPTGLTPADL